MIQTTISVLTVLTIGFVQMSNAQNIGFTEVSSQYGLNYGYGSFGFGTGMSFYDFNKDGLDDISFSGMIGESVFVFESTGDSLVQLPLPSVNLSNDLTKNLLWVDYDNDGDLDLNFTGLGVHSKLFRCNGAMDFTDVTFSVGLPSTVINSFSASWGDYNNDGYLDYYLANKTDGPVNPYKNMLFKSNNGLSFTDVTDFAGVGDQQGFAFQVIFTDFNKDNLPDIYVANDRTVNHNTLFKNLGDGTFEDVSDPLSTGLYIDGMGIAAGDFDNNGYEDLYVSNSPLSSSTGGNRLCINHGDETFTEVAFDLGIEVDQDSWGCSWADFDNDGHLDLFVANENAVVNSNSLFMNQGDGTFSEDTTTAIYQVSDKSFSSAVGDVNGDGYPDIIVMNQLPTTAKLWLNNGGDNNWVKITLEGTESNKEGIGSWIEAYFDGEARYRYTRTATSFQGQDGRATIFGLGQATVVDSVIVRWPSGQVSTISGLTVNETHHVVEPSLVTGIREQFDDSKSALQPNPAKDRTTIVFNTAFSGTLQLFDAKGRIISQKRVVKTLIEEVELPHVAGLYFISLVGDNGSTENLKLLCD